MTDIKGIEIKIEAVKTLSEARNSKSKYENLDVEIKPGSKLDKCSMFRILLRAKTYEECPVIQSTIFYTNNPPSADFKKYATIRNERYEIRVLSCFISKKLGENHE